MNNNISVTISNLGRIGHPLSEESIQTLGFAYNGGPDLLFEGAIICGTGATRISNAARGMYLLNDRDQLIHWGFRKEGFLESLRLILPIAVIAVFIRIDDNAPGTV